MKISPVKSYKAPAYPTRTDVQSNHDLLKHELPKSWINKKIIAGALAAYLFCSCKGESGKQSNIKTEILPGSERNNNKLNNEKPVRGPVYVAPLFSHGEGQGAWGCMVINPPSYLSEVDARYLIEEELKKEGIIFDKKNEKIDELILRPIKEFRESASMSKGVEIDEDGLKTEVDSEFITEYEDATPDTLIVDGYSSEYNLAYEYVGTDDDSKMSGGRDWGTVESYNTRATSENLREKFKTYGKLNAVVFYDPLYRLNRKERIELLSQDKGEADYSDDIQSKEALIMAQPDDYQDPDNAESIFLLPFNDSHKNNSKELLRKQVHDFIFWLKKENHLKDRHKLIDEDKISEKTGKVFIRDEYGYPLEEGEYINGEKHGYWIEYDKIGEKAAEGTYIQGNRNGKWTYYQGGSKSEEGEYKNGLKYGLWKKFDLFGDIKSEMNYKDGKRHGKWVEDLSLKDCDKGEYINGLKQGLWQEYFAFKHGTGNYKDGLRVGYWKYYSGYDSGDERIIAEGNYVLGKRDGKWIFYDEDADWKKRAANYENGIKTGFWKEIYSYDGYAEGHYRNGKMNGKWTFYLSGDKEAEIKYKDGIKNGKAVGFFSTGKKQWECTYVNNVINGKKIYFYPDGKIEGEENYKNGKPNGKWKIFDKNMHLIMEKGFTITGKLTGPFLDCYFDGNKKVESYYINGKLEGNSISYFDNGKVMCIAGYENGKLNGRYAEYNKEGGKIIERNYLNGFLDGTSLEWYDNGNKKSEQLFMNGALNGKSMAWYEKGNPKSEEEYSAGRKNGDFITWYENGNKESEIHYLNDRITGRLVKWFKNGNKSLSCNYELLPDGKYEEWYSNGNKRIKGNYENGIENGKWTFWYSNGKVKSEGKFLNGFKTGIWRHYKINGKLKAQREFISHRKVDK